MRSVVIKAYEEIIKTGKVKLFKSYRKEFKDGEQKRDFIYIKDVVDIMYQIIIEREDIKGIINIGSGKARAWNDLVYSVFNALGMPPNIEYIDMPLSMRDKYQYFTQAELSKLKKFGLRLNFTSLEDAVKDYIEYLKKGAYL
jgi:ADP-L-glycero-D-manno-heptose 6-epimerase